MSSDLLTCSEVFARLYLHTRVSFHTHTLRHHKTHTVMGVVVWWWYGGDNGDDNKDDNLPDTVEEAKEGLWRHLSHPLSDVTMVVSCYLSPS